MDKFDFITPHWRQAAMMHDPDLWGGILDMLTGYKWAVMAYVKPKKREKVMADLLLLHRIAISHYIRTRTT